MPVRPQNASPATKGRGAVGNPTGRYETLTRHSFDDGWTCTDRAVTSPSAGNRDQRATDGVDAAADPAFDLAPPLRTTVTIEQPRSIITRNTSPDIPFDRSVNPYRGCEHGCIYCFARPTHAWMGLSPGLDFESRLFAKPDAAALLERELRDPKYECLPIAMGTNTDPYQPIERTYEITRQVLEVLDEYNHPVSIVTKSSMITRDIDILASMARRRLVKVMISVTTLDRGLARAMEPRAPTPGRRLAAMTALAEAEIPTGVLVAPVVPFLTDSEIENILQAASGAGAECAGYVLLRLPHEIKQLFSEWLEIHVPAKAKRVLATVRDTRGGRLNDPDFGSRQVGQGAYARMIRNRFHLGCRRLGLNGRDWRMDTTSFTIPSREGDQLSLL